MERKLYYGIMTPGMILTLGFGIWMLIDYAWVMYGSAGWLHAKLGILVLLVMYHFYCGHCVQIFASDRNEHSHVYYRWINEIPVLFLFGTVILATVKPF